MRGTKGLDLLCWLGPAELVNFIKPQTNVRKGWSALGDVATLIVAWTLIYLVSASPKAQLCGLRSTPGWAQLGWCWPRGATGMDQKENPLLGWLWPSLLQQPSSPCSFLPSQDLPQNPSQNSSSTSLGNLLHKFAVRIFSRPHPWKIMTFQQLLIFTLTGKVIKKLLQKLWIVLKEHLWISSCWIQYYNQLGKILSLEKRAINHSFLH